MKLPSWALALALVLAAAPAFSACTRLPAGPTSDGFGFVLKYGVTQRNEVDAIKGTVTKDLVIDPPVTVNLHLSGDEAEQRDHHRDHHREAGVPPAPAAARRVRLRAGGMRRGPRWGPVCRLVSEGGVEPPRGCPH
jgi:hypothetical protein